MSISQTTDPRDAYLETRKRVQAMLDNGMVDSPSVSSKDLKALLEGLPPEPRPPSTFANFDARFVPFLRCAMDWDTGSPNYYGVHVTPLREGGAILMATNGALMALALDPSAECSTGGVRVQMPLEAMDACEPPTPFETSLPGDVGEVPAPDYMVPNRVLAHGVCLLITPVAQPPGVSDDDDAHCLLTCSIDTSSCISVSSYRHGKIIEWWNVITRLRLGGDPEPLTLSTPILAALAAACGSIEGVDYWHITDSHKSIFAVPTDRADLALVAMKCASEHAPGLPSWADYTPVGPASPPASPQA